MTVTTRRERRQQQRRQQQRRSASTGGGGGRSRGLNQLWIALGVVVIIIALALVGRAAGVFEAPAQPSALPSVDTSAATVGTHQDNIGNNHIPTGQKGNYTEGIPPTSGEHWAQPAAPAPWGIKNAWLQFEVTTHNMEHGGVIIMYNGITAQQVSDLQALVRSLGASGMNKLVLEPWPDMPKDSKVILTAWNWILKMPNPDDTTLVTFVRQHYDSSEAPEQGIP